MSKLAVSPSSLLLSGTVMVPMVPSSGGAVVGAKPCADWEITHVGPRGVPMMQYRHEDRAKALAGIVMELGWMSSDHMVGRIVLPAGLRLADGARIQIDDAPAGARMPLHGFGRRDCMVDISWTGAMIAALYAGQVLKVHARVASSKKPVVFIVPLNRFGAVADQLKELMIQRSQ
ncbi:invasion associated locus B family protein [Rhizobium sp. CSW-27]|uniref:invasion associated locus B family protein n=1 Tax=Rhizobium sp. CSW-27 TaxID=2839985 RepID=UPI001C0392AF|nr:invasion associated locus B family protein [Rhizobium sp. CSW-27]MBT9368974.1 invasion associated locus B family protein [Rhizobium sp. CSW-27]